MPTDPAPPSSRDNPPGVERLLVLTDGVVAISLTLLVLQLQVPAAAQVPHPTSASELATQLGKGTDELISYVISFYVIAQFWLVHHRVFRRVAGQRESLAWWNFAFLFTITLMPFTSNLLGKYSANPLAVDIFAFNLLAASLATQATVVFSHRAHLLITQTSEHEKQASRLRAATSILIIALSIGLAWVNTGAAKYCWLLLAIVPWAADHWSTRQIRTYDEPAESTGS
jgi:uncharacterized membrane protein